MMLKEFLLLALLGAMSSLAIAREQVVTLFNGKDLSGWVGTGYLVEDGVIKCTKQGRNLRTEKEYQNYIFSFEFKLPIAGNNGLGIHYPGQGDPAYTGIELQILDNSAAKYAKLKPSQYHGGVYKLKAAMRGYLKPVGEWNTQRVTVQGEHVIVELNGALINVASLDDLQQQYPKHAGVKRRKGYITFCGHGDAVEFKNISIREIMLKPNQSNQ